MKPPTLCEVLRTFGSDESCREYLEALRWPNGPVCPHCGNGKREAIYDLAANPAKGIRAGLRECKECEGTFTVTVGTIFAGNSNWIPRVAAPISILVYI